MPPHESRSFVPQFPHGASGWAGRGQGHSDPWRGSRKIPPSGSVPHGHPTGQGHYSFRGGSPRGYGQGTFMGTRDPRNVPLPVCWCSPTATSRSVTRGGVRRQGTVPHARLPQLCPSSRWFSQWTIPLNPNFPPGEAGALYCPPPGTASSLSTAQHWCSALLVPGSAMALPGGTWASRAPLPALPGGDSQGVPMQGDSGVTGSRIGGTHPLAGCPGQGLGRWRWRWG